MIELIIDNSFCQLKGLSIAQYKSLREVLSYTAGNGSYFQGKMGYNKRYLIDKKGVFPSGLLYLVNDWLNSTGEYNTVDLRVRPKHTPGMFNIQHIMRPYLEQKEAAIRGALRGSGTISMPTGTGKALTIALLIAQLQVKTLIVVPNLGLKKQLTASLKEWFGDLTNITVENIDSARLPKLTGYDALIIDECHHSAAATYRKLNRTAWKGIYYRLFFTATPFRSKNEEQLLMESITGPVIYEVTYQTAVDKGYICPVEAYYIELPKTELKCNPNSYPAVYSELVVNNQPRNELIANLLAKLDGTPTLCLVTEIRHGENLTSLTGGYFASGENEDTEHYITMFNNGTMKTLVGTTGVLGEGIDSRPAEYIIIAGLGKSKPRFQQQIGRGVRRHGDKTSCKIILFKDSSHKWALAHFREQCKILRDEYGVKPVKLDI